MSNRITGPVNTGPIAPGSSRGDRPAKPCKPSCCKTPHGHSAVRDNIPSWHRDACRCHREDLIMTTTYGAAPVSLGTYDLDFHEYMHYLYLPIKVPEEGELVIFPERLGFAADMIRDAIRSETTRGNRWTHIYVTARRGFATPGNPLNRPGWHSDGFGTPDINYVWTDRYPTLFAVQDFHGISDGHAESARQFEEQVDPDRIVTYADCVLQRLDASVIHTAPEIPAPGGDRSFFKISFSNSRYNLLGNSHNHLLDYDWPMHPRAVVRNDPARSEADFAS